MYGTTTGRLAAERPETDRETGRRTGRTGRRMNRGVNGGGGGGRGIEATAERIDPTKTQDWGRRARMVSSMNASEALTSQVNRGDWIRNRRGKGSSCWRGGEEFRLAVGGDDVVAEW